MQPNHIRLLDNVIKRRSSYWEIVAILATSDQRGHAKRFADPGHLGARISSPEDTQSATAEIGNGVVEVAELLRLLPSPSCDGGIVRNEAPTQREHQSEGMLGNRVFGVVANVRHNDAPLSSSLEVDHVRP